MDILPQRGEKTNMGKSFKVVEPKRKMKDNLTHGSQVIKFHISVQYSTDYCVDFSTVDNPSNRIWRNRGAVFCTDKENVKLSPEKNPKK